MGWMDGATMLHICAMEGSLEVMEYLLSLPEVDVNALDGFSETPAFFAAFWGWYEVGLTSEITSKKCFLGHYCRCSIWIQGDCQVTSCLVGDLVLPMDENLHVFQSPKVTI